MIRPGKTLNRWTAIPGTLARGESQAVIRAIRDSGNPTLDRALEARDQAADRRNYTSPCAQNPQLWDVRPEHDLRGYPSEATGAYLSRLQAAVEGCLGCEVFNACTGVLRALSPKAPEVVGVVAGEVVDPDAPMEVRQFFGLGEYSEGKGA